MNFICYSCETDNSNNFIQELEKIANKIKKSKEKKLTREDEIYNDGINTFLFYIKQKKYMCVNCGKKISGYRYLSQEGLCEHCEGCTG